MDATTASAPRARRERLHELMDRRVPAVLLLRRAADFADIAADAPAAAVD